MNRPGQPYDPGTGRCFGHAFAEAEALKESGGRKNRSLPWSVRWLKSILAHLVAGCRLAGYPVDDIYRRGRQQLSPVCRRLRHATGKRVIQAAASLLVTPLGICHAQSLRRVTMDAQRLSPALDSLIADLLAQSPTAPAPTAR